MSFAFDIVSSTLTATWTRLSVNSPLALRPWRCCCCCYCYWRSRAIRSRPSRTSLGRAATRCTASAWWSSTCLRCRWRRDRARSEQPPVRRAWDRRDASSWAPSGICRRSWSITSTPCWPTPRARRTRRRLSHQPLGHNSLLLLLLTFRCELLFHHCRRRRRAACAWPPLPLRRAAARRCPRRRRTPRARVVHARRLQMLLLLRWSIENWLDEDEAPISLPTSK